MSQVGLGMLRALKLTYAKVVLVIAAPIYLSYFFRSEVGREYGVGLMRKISLLWKFRRNTHRIPALSHWGEHLRLAAEILKVPRSIEGDVVECGCYKGASTANLSLVCALVGRKLLVYDSFEGLPPLDPTDQVHYVLFRDLRVVYEPGQFAARLEEVGENVRRWGNIGACEFVKGYFEQTLPTLRRPIVFAFLDVDLRRSLETCLLSIWPWLVEGGPLYSHEAEDLGFTSLFFDKEWWRENLRAQPPGFVGAGTGLPARVGEGSALGYTVKRGSEGEAALY